MKVVDLADGRWTSLRSGIPPGHAVDLPAVTGAWEPLNMSEGCEVEMSDDELERILVEFANRPAAVTEPSAADAADAAYRDWTGLPEPEATDLSSSAQGKLQRQIYATVGAYGFGGVAGPRAVTDDFG